MTYNSSGLLHISSLAARVRKWWRQSRAVTELTTMTDLELADLGIVRSDIYHATRE